jgi:hypothetical protein
MHAVDRARAIQMYVLHLQALTAEFAMLKALRLNPLASISIGISLYATYLARCDRSQSARCLMARLCQSQMVLICASGDCARPITATTRLLAPRPLRSADRDDNAVVSTRKWSICGRTPCLDQYPSHHTVVIVDVLVAVSLKITHLRRCDKKMIVAPWT